MLDINDVVINPRINELLIKILAYRYDYIRPLALGRTGARVLLSLHLSTKSAEILKTFVSNLDNPPKSSFEHLNDGEKRNMFRYQIKDELISCLTTEDTLKFAKEVLKDRIVKTYEHDNWNEYGEQIKYWRPELIESLKENGIQYDEASRQFSYADSTVKISITPYLSTSFIMADLREPLYENLKKEINLTYGYGLFTSALVLSRKLIENLLIDILREKYPASAGGLDIYYIASKGRFKDLSVLIDELEDRKMEFTPDVQVVERILDLIKPIRETANSSAHSVVFSSNKDDIEILKIPELIERLIYLNNRV